MSLILGIRSCPTLESSSTLPLKSVSFVVSLSPLVVDDCDETEFC